MPQTLPEGHPLAGPIALTALAAAFWAFPVSLLLLHLYRRRVVAGMGARAETNGLAPPVHPVATPEPPPRAGASSREDPHRVARRRAWRAAAVFGCGGMAYALVMAIAYTSQAGGGFGPVRLLVVTWHFAWPAVLTAAVAVAGSPRETARLSAAYAVGLVALGALATLRSERLSPADLVVLWLVVNGPGTLLVALFLTRSVRAVGPLVLAFLLVATGGANVALLLASTWEAAPRFLAEVGVALRLGAPVLVLGLVLAGAAVLSPVGYAVGRWLGRLYDGKRISDESIILDSMWLVFAVAHSVVLVAARGPAWLLAGVAAFAAWKAVTVLGLRLLRRRRRDGPAPRLLVLRAFSLGRRSERLFTALTKRWRHVGSVQLICGPDLAAATVEPHEFLDFMHGRIARRFVDGPASLEARLAEMDVEPDPDGRWRINELFCHDDMWRAAFARLLAMSDVVLMDLREFTRRSPGLAFELQEVARTAPLERVVILVDGATDRGYVQELASEAWRERTGPVGEPRPALGLVHARGAADRGTVLRALSAALTSERAAVS